mmetsp:Transcript_34330/g.100976  ORF Transcript_34330/g.100976 Transcript_34330/m.100976 type:complete len:212 (+) Transcript_34330:1305-1940(+)
MRGICRYVQTPYCLYHHHHHADCIVFLNASVSPHLSSQARMFPQPFSSVRGPNSSSNLQRKGNAEQSATVTASPHRYGPTTFPSRDCNSSISSSTCFPPRRTACLPTTFTLVLMSFRHLSIISFVSSLPSPHRDRPPSITPSAILVRMYSESINILAPPKHVTTGTSPAGFRSRKKSGLPPAPYRSICCISYGQLPASRANHTFCAYGHIL